MQPETPALRVLVAHLQAIIHYVSAKCASLSAFLFWEIDTILPSSSVCFVPVCSSVILPLKFVKSNRAFP